MCAPLGAFGLHRILDGTFLGNPSIKSHVFWLPEFAKHLQIAVRTSVKGNLPSMWRSYVELVDCCTCHACFGQQSRSEVVLDRKIGLEGRPEVVLARQTGLEGRQEVVLYRKIGLEGRQGVVLGRKFGLDCGQKVVLARKIGRKVVGRWSWAERSAW